MTNFNSNVSDYDQILSNSLILNISCLENENAYSKFTRVVT